jgi:hypothetical protein
MNTIHKIEHKNVLAYGKQVDMDFHPKGINVNGQGKHLIVEKLIWDMEHELTQS